MQKLTPVIQRPVSETTEEKAPRLMSKSQAARLKDPEPSPEDRIVGDRGPRGENVFGRVAHSMGAAKVDRHPVYRYAWLAANVLLIVAALVCIYGSIWEFSTRQYL